MAPLKECLFHWKKTLERNDNEEKVLNTISKLYKVPITVELLRETGIGKVIKQVGKKPGKVGEYASAVLKRWRDIVSSSTEDIQKQSAHEKPSKEKQKASNGIVNGSHHSLYKEKTNHFHQQNGYSPHFTVKQEVVSSDLEDAIEKRKEKQKASNGIVNGSHHSLYKEKTNHFHQQNGYSSHFTVKQEVLSSDPEDAVGGEEEHFTVKQEVVSSDPEDAVEGEEKSYNKNVHCNGFQSGDAMENSFTHDDLDEDRSSKYEKYNNGYNKYINGARVNRLQDEYDPEHPQIHPSKKMKLEDFNYVMVNENEKHSSSHSSSVIKTRDSIPNGNAKIKKEHKGNSWCKVSSSSHSSKQNSSQDNPHGVSKKVHHSNHEHAKELKVHKKRSHSFMEHESADCDRVSKALVPANGLKSEKKHSKHSSVKVNSESSTFLSSTEHKAGLVKLSRKSRDGSCTNGKSINNLVAKVNGDSSCKSVSKHSREKREGKDHHLCMDDAVETKSVSKLKTPSKVKVSQTEELTASEASFEACLGLNDVVITKKKKNLLLPLPTAVQSKSVSCSDSPVKKAHHKSKDKDSKSKSSSKRDSEKSSKESSKSSKSSSGKPAQDITRKKLVDPPKPPPLDKVDIISTLPEIQPNYRPLPRLEYDDLPAKKKALSNEEAIIFTSSKKDRTAVYSGRRNLYATSVPSLYELCTRILIDNMDFIGYTGGVPFYLLKPVLERCTPVQLYKLEDYNPYLLSDTQDLWERHCQKDFRSAKREEGETFREMYLRCFEEKERKLKALTANISASMSKSNPVKQVKLAYVDSVVKPPREVARKQARNGTALPVNHTVKAGPPSKASPRPTAPAINAANIISSKASGPPAMLKKPKVAPLMAKTLKSMKKIFRR